MSKVDTVEAAPDSSQIIDLLLARLKGTQHIAFIKRASNSALPMLMDRFSPEMRQRLFSFIEERDLNDVVLAKGLISDHITRPNVIAAVVATLDPIRKINSVREDYQGNVVADIREHCRNLGIELREEEIGEPNFCDVIATHFVTTILKAERSQWELSAVISDHLMKHPDFLDDAHLLVPLLTARAETYVHPDRLSAEAIFETASIIRQSPSDGLRMVELVRHHKGYNTTLIGELLASDPTPLESGVL